MPLTRQRTISLGVLGLGLAALGVDRLVLSEGASLSGPALSEASSLAVVPSAPTPEALPTGGAAGPVSPSDLLADLALRENFDLGNVRDAFAAWPGKDSAPEPEAAPARSVSLAVSAAEFESRHRISALIAARGGSNAVVIDGRALRIGDTIDGFRLESIDEDGARFVREDERATLRRLGGSEKR